MHPLQFNLRQLPSIRTILDKSAFDPVAAVPLRFFGRLDEATCWCEGRWRSHGRRYQRRIGAAERTATFSFASAMDALAFRLKFG